MSGQPKLQQIYHCISCNRGWGGTAIIIAPKYWQCTQCSYKKK